MPILHTFEKDSNNDKVCKYCKSFLVGSRSNKYFCNLYCRHQYHQKNGKQKEWDKNWYEHGGREKKREYRKEHPKIGREAKKRYQKRHPEQRRNGNGGIKRGAFDRMRTEFNYTCPMCGQKEPFLNQYWPQLVQDHIIPRSRGGKKRAQENIQPLCWDCNTKKGNNHTLLKLT